MARKEGRKKEKCVEQQATSSARNRFHYWQIPVIVLILILLGVIVSLAQYYTSSLAPMECYHCNWIARANGPSLVDDPCGQDQRARPNSANVKTCAPGQNYCGTLHVTFTYAAAGGAKKFEFAFVRDCFSEYPLPYAIQIGKNNGTYYGSRDGNVYPNVAGMPINMTVVGQQCEFWNLCNSNIPREGLGWAFLDSFTIFYQAKQKGLSIWDALVNFVEKETNVPTNLSQTVA